VRTAMRGAHWFGVALLVLVVLEVAAGSDCGNNPSLDTSNGAFKIFNSCYRDESKYGFPLQFSAQVISWFATDAYLQYLLIVIMIIPYISFVQENEENSIEVAMERTAKANVLRLNVIMLMFRVALAGSMDAWLKAAFQQERPCLCYSFVLGDGIWGMPSGDSMTATVLALSFVEYVSIPLGLFFFWLVPVARVLLGYHSIGQVLAGIGFGVAIHFYTTRTPMYARFVDVILNAIAGMVVFFLVEHNHPSTDFSRSIGFFTLMAWQIFALLTFLAVYNWSFVRATLPKTTHSVAVPDFLYYIPLNSNESPLSPTSRNEAVMMTTLIVLLFISLFCAGVYSPYFGETMSKILNST